MNFYLKTYIKVAVLAAFPYLAGAQEAYRYSEEGWRKNLTWSLGVTGLRSNVDYKGDNKTASVSADPKWGFGIMTSVELGLADYAGVSLGAYYLQRRFQISGGPIDWTRTIPTVFVPLEARFYLAKVLSIGAGAFASIPVGSTRDSFSRGDSTLTNTGSGRSGVDYGLTGALGVNIPLESFGAFAELRYNHGLTDSAATRDVEEKIRDLLLTVGVKLKI
jgi:hypothetical protein